MFSLRRPSTVALGRIRDLQAKCNFTYVEVGATNLPPSTSAPPPTAFPTGFALDHVRVELGKGADTFDRARKQLAHWQQFKLGWLGTYPDDAPIRTGEVVLVIARAGGLWWTNAARIVYTVDEKDSSLSRFGFAYGTLPSHVEVGEERFLIEWDHATDIVYFDILAFSRPRHFLVRHNARRARAMQKRFASEATAAMQRAVAKA